MAHATWNGWTKEVFIGIDDFGEPKYSQRTYYRCSKCHYGTVVKTPYCPQCGSEMDKNN